MDALCVMFAFVLDGVIRSLDQRQRLHDRYHRSHSKNTSCPGSKKEPANMERPLLLFLLSTLAFGASAQSMLLHLENGTTENYSLSDVRSITFEGDDMQLNMVAGTTLAWPIAEVRSYAFDLMTTGVEKVPSVGSVSIHPNPAQEQVMIHFESLTPSHVTIDIIDGTGREVTQLFRGETADKMIQAGWDIREQGAVAPGLYLCRITTQSGVLTTPLIIQ